ncbi:MAG: hypothetical protein LBR16_04050 [Treponema sp.]|jgi:hypothetical protein|nr:hypothetical protein [Treponema sp.]
MKRALALLLGAALILNSCVTLNNTVDKKRLERIAGLAGLLVINGTLMALANQNQYLQPDDDAKNTMTSLGISFAISIAGWSLWMWNSEVSAASDQAVE